MTTTAAAQNSIHPQIGTLKPRDLKASDILALPEREREAWIHGAVSLMAQTAARYDQDFSGCILGWYFESNGSQIIELALESYRDRHATSLVVAAASSACAPN